MVHWQKVMTGAERAGMFASSPAGLAEGLAQSQAPKFSDHKSPGRKFQQVSMGFGGGAHRTFL